MPDPASLGFDAERLARLDRFMNRNYVETGRLAGVQVLISRRGQIVHELVVGQRDVARDLPAESDTVYRIFSMSKPITSLAFMMLVEEGLVALEDPVTRFVPEFADLGVFSAGAGPLATTPPARSMRMIDLLRHTSGLTYGIQRRNDVDAAYRKLKLAEPAGPLGMDGFIAELAKLPLEFSPGEAWNYSVSTDVLGVLVQRISGQSFGAFLKERIFDPLGMDQTGFSVREDQKSRFAACYVPKPGGGMTLVDDPQTSPYLAAPNFESGGGGLVSTAADYMKFCHMLIHCGAWNGQRLIAPKTLKLMASNHLPGGQDLTAMSRSMYSESTNAGVGFGLGFAVIFDPVQAMLPSSPGEFYWGGAASTAFWIDPVEEVAVVLMTQLVPSSTYPIRRELRTLVYSALVEPN